MKRKYVALASALAIALTALTGCGGSTAGLTKVRLQEVAHSIFYAPMYVAIEEGYFKEEGLDVELTNGIFWLDEMRIQISHGRICVGRQS